MRLEKPLIAIKSTIWRSFDALESSKEKLKRLSFFAIISLVLVTIAAGCGTPIFKAIKKGDNKKVEYLLDNGTDVNSFCTTGKNWTPLMIAASYGSVQLTEILLRHGADPSLSNIQGHNAAWYAEQNQQTVVIRMLKDAEEKQYKNLAKNDEKITPSVVDNNTKAILSDVDVDIPVNNITKPNTYALIIGNEDYSSFQTGLSTEVNVDYAINDAKVFKEYCTKTFSIPEKQVKLLTNATAGQMSQGIAWLNNLAMIDDGKAELIFFYSGHGLPLEQTKEPYIIPVDISGNNVSLAIKLADLYSKLNEYPVKKVTVFLDACFSGGGRNQGLIAMKGVKIKPKENLITGNMVVFSSSTGEESSGVYREKQHGYMTYYLLKKLQETKGDITYKELADFVVETVKKETALNGKIQTPQCSYSPSVEHIWSNWKIK
jgi:hypothetical protein